MFLRELTASVSQIKGAGPAVLAMLARLGVNSAGALLRHYPRDWEDRSRTVPLRDFSLREVCTTVTVLSHEWFGAGYMKTLKIHVEDDTARAVLVCFNRPFLGKQLPVGAVRRIYGRFQYKYGELQSSAFEIESPRDEGEGRGGILPVYPLTEGLTQNLLRKLMKNTLDLYAGSLESELSPALIEKEGLLPKPEALRAIHFPASLEEKDRARKTLIYEELFYLELIIGMRAQERKKTASRVKRSGNGEFSALQKRLIQRLPFNLTPGQLEAVREINRDMDNPPMARLLQGDVGSGKTLVSFLAALRAVETGASGSRGQAVLMAPTELLARQHAENAAKLLEPLGVSIAFLTGNIRAGGRAQLLKALAAGEVDIAAGTHALFSQDVIYRNLTLAVIDEQHRFGVTQRQAVMSKGERPGLLMMSATPIPRTLALTVFGDLDVSTIRDMPPGRKPVKTHLARESNEGRVYDFVRQEIAAGHQAYFVYPLIDAGEGKDKDAGNLKDVSTMARRLSQEIFPEYTVALIHSRLEEEDKRKTMDAFRKGEIRVLAATSVVEVGVDVPNATCMVIEHAEHFGLAALHQLRGRVGRGEDQSYCFLIYSDQDVPREFAGTRAELLSEEERSKEGKRLMVMLENTDGFVIAEKDLLFRGPGQIAGIEQSGYLALGIADPLRDTEELVRARAEAFEILNADPELQKPENLCILRTLERAPPFKDVGL
ncbi:MAG: ATP-dependent DNA helicase RecG [Treponema sp.]|jgi:ATP-dependent DNA helicase RecG|nr:ATP-dependent DNA helicase RecG [Treponema sp.]